MLTKQEGWTSLRKCQWVPCWLRENCWSVASGGDDGLYKSGLVCLYDGLKVYMSAPLNKFK